MLEVRDLSKRFDSFSLKGMTFTVRDGEYFILLGISGAGKSLLLELIAGLTLPDSGRITLDGQDITRTKIQQRGVGLVFQDYAVFPHLSVRENIGYSLQGKHLSPTQKKQMIRDISVKMDIRHLLDRRPSTLSGGELQRVALARTLVQNPKILLLDEPLSSLDSKLRSGIRSILRQLKREGQTVIHVTHDYEEAVSLGDTIAVVHEGEIVQTGSPEEVFAHPKSEFVAHFIGIKNFFKATVIQDRNGEHAIVGGKHKIMLGPGEYTPEGFLLIRGEDIILSKKHFESSATNHFCGKVTEVVPTRSGIEVVVDAGITFFSLITKASADYLGIREGGDICLSFKATAVRFISI